jgi:hypothetical protein
LEGTPTNPEETRFLTNLKWPILLTKNMASEMTGLDAQYLDKLRKLGLVKVYRTLGGQNRFHRDSLVRHIERNLTHGNRLQG